MINFHLSGKRNKRVGLNVTRETAEIISQPTISVVQKIFKDSLIVLLNTMIAEANGQNPNWLNVFTNVIIQSILVMHNLFMTILIVNSSAKRLYMLVK
jgi:hypothetical protein